MKGHQKDAVLTLDEMTIKPARRYDVAADEFIGNVNLPDHDDSQTASKALVFMLAGVTSKVAIIKYTPIHRG